MIRSCCWMSWIIHVPKCSVVHFYMNRPFCHHCCLYILTHWRVSLCMHPRMAYLKVTSKTMTFCPEQCIDDGVKEILTDLGRPCRCCPQEKGFPGRKPCSWEDATLVTQELRVPMIWSFFLSKNVDDQRMDGCWWQGGPPNRDTRRWWSFFFNDDNDDKVVYLIWIPDDDLVVRLSRCVDQLQCDAGKVDCQPIREHLLKR